MRTLGNPVNYENVAIFAYWSSILALKALAMVLLIGRWRWSKLIFLSPEDTKFVTGSRTITDDPDIERCRRAHLNDLENILPWALSTAVWLTTSPPTWLVDIMIKSFAISRIMHTIVYAVIVIPQPARFLAFGIGFLVTIAQAVLTIVHYS